MNKKIKNGLVSLLAATTISGCASIDRLNPYSGRSKYESLPKVIIEKIGPYLTQCYDMMLNLRWYDEHGFEESAIVDMIVDDNIFSQYNVIVHAEKLTYL